MALALALLVRVDLSMVITELAPEAERVEASIVEAF